MNSFDSRSTTLKIRRVRHRLSFSSPQIGGRLLLVAGILGGSAACSDASGPAVEADSPLSLEEAGTPVLSMWHVTAEGLALGAAVSAPANLGWEGASKVGGWGPHQLEGAEIDALRASLSRSPVLQFEDPRTIERESAASAEGSPPLRRYRFEDSESDLDDRTIVTQLLDGREVRTVLSRAPGTSGRPAAAVLTYVDGVALSLSEYKYRRQKGVWVGKSVRTTLFDEYGTVVAVVAMDLTQGATGPRGSALISESATLRSVAADIERLACEVRGLFAAQELYAAPVPQLPGCVMELYTLQGALTLQAAALVTSSVAASSCIMALPSCPAYLGALVGLGAATLGVNIAQSYYFDCMAQYDQGSGGSGSGGGGDEYEDCYLIVIEISNDGGHTWEYLGTVWACE